MLQARFRMHVHFPTAQNGAPCWMSNCWWTRGWCRLSCWNRLSRTNVCSEKSCKLPQHSTGHCQPLYPFSYPLPARKEQNTIDVVRTGGCSPLCLHLEKQQSKKRIFRTSLFNLCCTSSRFWKQACLQCWKCRQADVRSKWGDDSGLLHAFQENWWTFPKLQPTSAPEWWQPDLRSWIHLPGKICHMLPHKFVATKAQDK